MEEQNTEIKIIIQNIENDEKIIFKPYSSLFKNPVESYQSFSFDLINLNQDEDIILQLAKIAKPIVDNIIKKENSSFPEHLNFLKENLNNTFSVPYSSVNNIGLSVTEPQTNTPSISSSQLNFIL
jgi:hypothetical protein